MREENRQYFRYGVTCQLRGKALRPLERVEEPCETAHRGMRGVVTDISGGGIGMFSDGHIAVAELCLCEIMLASLPVGIPTLLQVRWVLEDGQGHTYRAGLQFMV